MPHGTLGGNNPTGVNQYRTSINSEQLEIILTQLINVENVTQWATILSRLESEHGISMKRSTLGKYLKTFGLGGSRRADLDYGATAAAVISHVLEHDPLLKDGPSEVAHQLGQQGIHVKRDLVRQAMLDHFNEGFDRRARNAKNKTQHLGVLHAVGPLEEVSIDGHDKLSALGFPIYGMRDKFSRRWLVLKAIPSNRVNRMTGILYLQLVQELGAVPLQLTSDCGNEVLDIYSYQNALRWVTFMQRLGWPLLPEAHRFLTSTSNITVERGWRRLSERFNSKFKTLISNAIAAGVYLPGSQPHRLIYFFLFVPLVNSKLELFRLSVNRKPIRKQRGTSLPTGESPDTMFLSRGIYCGVKLGQEGLKQVEHWETMLGGRKALEFLDKDESTWAEELYERVGRRLVTLTSVWDVFQSMASHL
ncbi:hypothetical protein M231_04060 [Tremella mesenterica]|uniref:Integrase catalytic domain-containing protein n=1 Tax=Tremella mesenterica TaxID=5217 RepID=A0A4Q1BLI7_TREME|nr:hypothetical protein M231_04060 [Tremella mesenterica]